MHQPLILHNASQHAQGQVTNGDGKSEGSHRKTGNCGNSFIINLQNPGLVFFQILLGRKDTKWARPHPSLPHTTFFICFQFFHFSFFIEWIWLY